MGSVIRMSGGFELNRESDGTDMFPPGGIELHNVGIFWWYVLISQNFVIRKSGVQKSSGYSIK